MSATLHITADGERKIVQAFVNGASIADIATISACSNRAIEAVIRSAMRQVMQRFVEQAITAHVAQDLTAEPEVVQDIAKPT